MEEMNQVMQAQAQYLKRALFLAQEHFNVATPAHPKSLSITPTQAINYKQQKEQKEERAISADKIGMELYTIAGTRVRPAGVHRLRSDLIVDTLQGFQVREAHDGTEWKHWSVDNKWLHFMSPTNQKMQGCERIGQYAHKVQVLISTKYKETWVEKAPNVDLDKVERENTPPAPKRNSLGEPSQKSTSRKLPGPDLRQELQEAAQTHVQKANEGHLRTNLESESSGYVPYGNAECVERYKERMYTSPYHP